MVEYLTQDQGFAGLSFTGGTVRHFILRFGLVQPRKTHPNRTEKIVDLHVKNQCDIITSHSDKSE